MVKPLTFKGDKRPKKRKRPATAIASDGDNNLPSSASKPDASPQPPTTTADSAESTQIWTSADLPTDIAGPILLAFAAPLPYCLACDANGKVFASQIENIYTDDGSTGGAMMATAEPHDVRQVWVACKVGGMEGWGFRGHHGRYLSSDKFGILSAHREAISSEETFHITPHSSGTPGTFSIQTSREAYLTFSSSSASNPSKDPPSPTSKKALQLPNPTPALRADSPSPTHPIYIRMQTAHKTRLSTSLAAKASEKISRRELEDMVGRRLEEEEVRRLKKARREGGFHEAVLDVRVKGKHDKFAC